MYKSEKRAEYLKEYRNRERTEPEMRRKYMARERARYKYKERQQCSREGCTEIGERHHPDYDKPLLIEWLCVTHHNEVHLVKKVCSIEGCDKPHHGRGFCRHHHYLYKRSIGEWH